MTHAMNRLALAASALALAMGAPMARADTPTPDQILHHHMGEDAYVPSYDETVRYWQTLAKASDRIRLIDIGATTEKRRHIMAAVSSPENLAKLDDYRRISQQLGTATGIDEAAARAMAAQGKAVVWIDGGLHAAEVEAQTALIQQVYDMVSGEDAEARHIRDNVIILFAPDNPDGQQFVADWYMRFADPARREANLTTLPRLYHPYAGHDNNRDFFMGEMVESRNIADILYRGWRPQIIFNQHQTGPAGTVLFLPPFRDPFNYHYEPLIITQLAEVGATLQSRLLAENKPGATSRSGAHYDTWYNGSLRTSTYFHNAIGILAEIIGSPRPEAIPFVPERQVPGNDLTAPVTPQLWHMQQSIDYSVSLARGLLTYAANNREKMLFDRWRMGANAIAKGSSDQWTVSPDRIAQVHAAAAAAGDKPRQTRTNASKELPGHYYTDVLHAPEARDPRAFIVPVAQHDFPTTARFLTALHNFGVEIERASAPFTAAGQPWPAGTYIVPAAQAYRAHVLDMFEPQHYPDNYAYPGGPPVAPADASGYTPAFEMGVTFARSLDAVTAQSVPVKGDILPDTGAIAGQGRAGWLISHAQNNSFMLLNRLGKAGVSAYELADATQVAGGNAEHGAIWVPGSARAAPIIAQAVATQGIVAQAVDQAPTGPRLALKRPRVGVVDLYGGLMPTGWLRWIFDNNALDYQIVYPQQLDKGRLARDFDVVILPDAAIADARSGGKDGMFRGRFENAQPRPEDIPAQYRASLGLISAEKTLPALRDFVDAGGRLVAMGSSSSGVAAALNLPVDDPLYAEKDGRKQPPDRRDFYVPGALLAAKPDTAQPIAWGLPDELAMFFDASPVFRLRAGATAGVPLSFAAGNLLKSGWAIHPERLAGAAAVVDVPRGKGDVVLIGPEVILRGQTQAAYKILFNAISQAGARNQPASKGR